MEQITINSIIKDILKGNDDVKLNPDIIQDAFRWHYLNNKKFLNDIIKERSLRKEIETINNILNGEANEQKLDEYFNQIYAYLEFHIFDNKDTQTIILKNMDKLKIDEEARDYIFQETRKAISIYGHPKTPLELFKILRKYYRNENKNIKRSSKLNLKASFVRIVEGSPLKSDENKVQLYTALHYHIKFIEEELKGNNLDSQQRIRTIRSKKEVQKYFYQLKKVGIKENDINTLLSSSFSCFPDGILENKIIANCSQGALRHFVYYFYEMEMKAGAETQAKYYIYLLLNSFEAFSNTSFKSLQGHFGDGQPLKYPFKENLVNM